MRSDNGSAKEVKTNPHARVKHRTYRHCSVSSIHGSSSLQGTIVSAPELLVPFIAQSETPGEAHHSCERPFNPFPLLKSIITSSGPDRLKGAIVSR